MNVLQVGYFIIVGVLRLWETMSDIELGTVVDLEEAFTTLCDMVKWSAHCACTARTTNQSLHKAYSSFFSGNQIEA